MASVFDHYEPMKGDIQRRSTGSLVAFETGEAVTYGLFNARSGAPCSSGPAPRCTAA